MNYQVKWLLYIYIYVTVFLYHYFNESKINLLIIEGYKNEPIQKLEIYRHELEKPLLFKNDVNIFALASNKDVKTDLPLFDLNNINEITRFIENKFLL